MKAMKTLFLISFLFGIVDAQIPDPLIGNIISQTNLDSLMNNVRILSGEDSVKIGNSMELIEHRVDAWGNYLAGNYIKQKLAEYNLDVSIQKFNIDGLNIIAFQPGNLFPEKQYIICAHYDAVDYFCADDNASGTAAVLEAARILSNYDFLYHL